MTAALVAVLVAVGFALGSGALALARSAVLGGWPSVSSLALALAPGALLAAAEVWPRPPPGVGVCDAVSLLVLGSLLALAAYLSTRPPPPPPLNPAFVAALRRPPPPTDALRRAMASSEPHPLARPVPRDPVCSSCVTFVRADTAPGQRFVVELDIGPTGVHVRAPCAWCREPTPYRARWVSRALEGAR